MRLIVPKLVTLLLIIHLIAWHTQAQQVLQYSPAINTTPLLRTTTTQQLGNNTWQSNVYVQELDMELYPDPEALEEAKYKAIQQLPVGAIPKLNTRGNPPVLGKNFLGNKLHVFVPCDNSIGISNNGLIVSADNYNLTFADSNGTIIKDSLTWPDFTANDTNLKALKFDPRVIYDPTHDRFIVIILQGPADPVHCKLVIAFSKTNNPIDGWHLYGITGNPFNDTSFADYPNVAVNAEELFINVNLFKVNSNFDYNQSIIYQLSLDDGYNGATSLSYKLWGNNFATPSGKPSFTMVPVTHGMGTPWASGMQFVSTWPADDSLVYYYKITGNLADINAQFTVQQFAIPPYTACANGRMIDKATGFVDSINTGSSMVQNAIYLDSNIYFTFNANFYFGWCGIYVGKLNLRNNTTKVKFYGEPGSYLSYPALAAMGADSTNATMALAYVQADTNTYPQVNAISMDEQMSFSNPLLVKQGDTSVNMLYPPQYVGRPERWGDYTGIQRLYNSKPPQAWLAAGYGGNNSRKASWNTWIAQLTLPNYTTGLSNNQGLSPSNELQVYPNPTTALLHTQFNNPVRQQVEINIYNSMGKLVHCLHNGVLPEGTIQLQFNTKALSKGVYFIRAFTKSNKLYAKQIIVQ
jgi:hypothetical protein